MLHTITKDDLSLVNSLSVRKYFGNQLHSNAQQDEINTLKSINSKLKEIAIFFGSKYGNNYGPFSPSVATGNPIAIDGKTFKRVWAGIFKGSSNKQYAAQLSFVMNPSEPCLDVGFYFGRASGHSLNKAERLNLKTQLNNLGRTLSSNIKNNIPLFNKYNSLFDFGFKTFTKNENVSGDIWLDNISSSTESNEIIIKIFPNDFNVIEISTIDYYVSETMFLMGCLEYELATSSHAIKPLTPEQRAKQAERLALIGQNGELFAMNYERERLNLLKLQKPGYPKHVSLEDMSLGFDILSLDQGGNEIYIEVKTTTRIKSDPFSKQFFISSNEYTKYSNNKSEFKLYRVYDIEGVPCIEEIDLSKVAKVADGYIIKY